MQWFIAFVNFLNPELYLKNNRLMDFIIPISFAVVILHAFCMGLAYYRHKKKAEDKDIVGLKK